VKDELIASIFFSRACLQGFLGILPTSPPFDWSVATHQVVFQKPGNLSLNYGAHWQPGSHNLAFITPLPAPKNAVKPVPGLEIWNVTTRQLVKSIAGLNVSTWAWSPDGQKIAYASSYSDGSASPAAVAAVLDVNSGQTVYPYKVSSGTIGALAWSPNGNYIVTSDNMLQDTTPTLQQSYVVQVWVA
jgi:WD40 repeat protein